MKLAYALLIVVALPVILMLMGWYGLTLFVVLPLVAGAWTAVRSAKSMVGAAGYGALAGFIGSFSLVAFGLEGLICVAMSLPLVVPLSAIGGMCSYSARRRIASAPVMLAILPLFTLGFDTTATPPVYEVHSSMEIAAPPETVWHNVVTFSDIPEPQEWYFHTGLAYPKRARIEGTGPSAIRYCEFSTGPFVEPIKVWDEPRLLRFSVTSNPAPMHEWSPYGDVHPKHLDGYMISKQGQFLLTPLANGGTLLEGTTWYQHGLWPSQYWRLWSDAIIHRIHMRVLQHIKKLSET
jgi:hypothetical protein